MTKQNLRTETCAEIQALSRKLLLSSQLSETCLESGTQKQLDFVRDLLAEEAARREQNKINRLLKKAAFPCFKTFENYEANQIAIPDDFSLDAMKDSSFARDKLNLVLYGPVGTGKTHLAVAAGIAACKRGMSVRFYTVASLVRLLGTASKNGKLDKVLRDIQQAELLILDEWGYVPIDTEGARLLFQIVSDSYERRSVVITTNLEFSRWGTVISDQQMAAAMIDRLIHHGYLLVFQGESYRMTHALMRRDAAAS